MSQNEILAALDAIRERADAATPGPWFEQYDYDGGRTICQMRSTDTLFCVNRACHVKGNPWEKTKENGEFIAHARSDIPALDDCLRIAVAALRVVPDDPDHLARQALDAIAERLRRTA